MAVASSKNSTNASITDHATQYIQDDIHYLQHNSSSDHVQRVVTEYRQQNNAQNALIAAILSVPQPNGMPRAFDFQQSVNRTAVRQDLIKMLHVLHQQLNGTEALDMRITNLHSVGSDQLSREVTSIVSDLQRNVLMTALSGFRSMKQSLQAGLWGASHEEEAQLISQFQGSEANIEQAISLFDAGDMQGAFQKYSATIRDNKDRLKQFESATSTDFYLKFSTGVGILFTAGLAGGLAGGATLSAMTGSAAVTETTGIGALVALLTVTGTTCAAANKFLSHQILHVPYFHTHDVIENSLEFAGESLKMAALVGYMRGFGAIVEIPMYSGFAAPAVNFASGVGGEFLGVTSFTAITDGPAVALAPENMAQGLATVLGLRTAHSTVRFSMNGASKFARSFRDAVPPLFAPYPLMLATHVMPSASRLSSGANDLVTRVMANEAVAIARGQNVGFELEFGAGNMGRDVVHQLAARAFQEAGYDTQLHQGAQDFVFGQKPQTAIMLRTDYTLGERTVTTSLFQGGNKMVGLVDPSDGRAIAIGIQSDGRSVFDVEPRLHGSVAKALNLHTPYSISLLRYLGRYGAVQDRSLFLAKDASGDTMQLGIEVLTGGNIRLTGENCLLYGMNGELLPTMLVDVSAEMGGTQIPMRRHAPLRALETYLNRRLTEGPFAQKRDVVSGVEVTGLGRGRFKVIDELPPSSELVTPIMTIDELAAIEPLIARFANQGFVGTTDNHLVGMHVHAEVPRTVATPEGPRFSIAPVLGVLRAFLSHRAHLNTIFTSHPNRSPFIQEDPTSYQRLAMHPGYIADPIDPMQILKFIADYSKYHPAKYNALNLDHFNAAMVNEMGRAGILQDGQVIEFSDTNFVGFKTDYRLRVSQEGGGFRIYRYFDAGDVYHVDAMNSVSQMPSAGERLITRVDPDHAIPTVEFRTPNAEMDPKKMTFTAKFFSIFVDMFSHESLQ